MKEQTRDILRQIPWVGVILILLTGVIVSVGIVFFRQSVQINTPGIDETVYTLKFLDEKGQLLEQQDVNSGGFVVPPSLESVNDGIAFRAWSQKLYGINRSTEVIPTYQDLRQEKNAFYFDAQYVLLGEETVAELWLNGDVCISGVELVLEYDSEVLCDLFCDVEGSPFTVASTEPNKVVLKLDEAQNLTEPMTVAVVRFTVNETRDDVAKTTIRISMEKPMMIENGGEVGTDCCAVHGDVYLLS